MREGDAARPADPSIPSRRGRLRLPEPRARPRVERARAAPASRSRRVADRVPVRPVPLAVKLDDVEEAVAAGADEIDMVIDRGAFLSGRYAKVYDEIVRVKEACGDAHLKVILETGELGTYDNVRRASLLAMAAGADFIKTSTGKLPQRRDAAGRARACSRRSATSTSETGRVVGMKPAGGIRTAKQAIQYLVHRATRRSAPTGSTPDRFRLGASSLLNDVLMQIREAAHRPLPEPGLLHA